MHKLGVLVFALSSVCVVRAQIDAFALPQARQYAAKPTVTPDIQKYFELDGHAREFVDTLLGPRPGGKYFGVNEFVLTYIHYFQLLLKKMDTYENDFINTKTTKFKVSSL
jgi:hypothetical protein